MMKRLISIFFALLLGTVLFAQEGLFVEELFEGRGIAPRQMKKTFISGAKLEPYRLDTYKSITFQMREGLFHTVEVLVEQDAKSAVDKQVEYVNDHLTYAVITLNPTYTGLNRYLCFQAKQNNGIWDITLVYLRGTASVEDLEKMFNKRKK